MTTTNRDPDCCRTCGDEFGRAKLMAGECDGCRNEADGLCWCGGEPIPGHDRCAECQADEAADVRFHAMHEGAM